MRRKPRASLVRLIPALESRPPRGSSAASICGRTEGGQGVQVDTDGTELHRLGTGEEHHLAVNAVALSTDLQGLQGERRSGEGLQGPGHVPAVVQEPALGLGEVYGCNELDRGPNGVELEEILDDGEHGGRPG